MTDKQKAQLEYLRANDKAVSHKDGQVEITIKCWDCDQGERSVVGYRDRVYKFFGSHEGHDTSVGIVGHIEAWGVKSDRD